ncbi:MAG TPA: ribosomal-processing cysteine protease Prp [Pseudogracilibacillus sp.]|nr:ribosomal-processing cysteine protease Prp [Pseudogracilibacillus sp.]
MINVTICRKNSHIQSFEISGHANSGPYGYDLVCAAVSAVSFGAVNAALTLSGSELDITQGGEGGYLAVAIPEKATDEQRKKIYDAFEVMFISLQTIERDYSQFIKIEEVSSSC